MLRLHRNFFLIHKRLESLRSAFIMCIHCSLLHDGMNGMNDGMDCGMNNGMNDCVNDDVPLFIMHLDRLK